MKPLGILLLIIVAIPASALLETVAARNVWSWFLATQYGPGPTLGAWFGISVTVSILTGRLHGKWTGGDELRVLVIATANAWARILLFLVVAYGVGSIFGWVQ